MWGVPGAEQIHQQVFSLMAEILAIVAVETWPCFTSTTHHPSLRNETRVPTGAFQEGGETCLLSE